MIIGRKKELSWLQEAYASDESEFVAVYGRRRVGKTYLVREKFEGRFTFTHAGLAHGNKISQLEAWSESLKEAGMEQPPAVRTWIQAFGLLKELIKTSRRHKKVIFIDEMPWMDTQHSGFVTALEFFWNGWASARKDVLLIVCGSATSWIINNIIRNHGGLHNRVTRRIHVKPFSLYECELYSKAKKMGMSRRQLLECYMIMGGIPYYWTFLDRTMTLAQNIDELFFSTDGQLRGEFDELYASLFRNPERYIDVVVLLGTKRAGMTRKEIASEGHFANNGNLTRILRDLENCDFIRKYCPLGRKTNDAIYQLIDFYTLFYFKFINGNNNVDQHFWSHNMSSPQYVAWTGLAFERVCFEHVPQIKDGLKIGGVLSNVYSWRVRKYHTDERGAQIDMLIDRNDQVITLCEMKFSRGKFTIDTEYDEILVNKIERFRKETKTHKAIQVAIITPIGITANEYSDDIQNILTFTDLFSY